MATIWADASDAEPSRSAKFRHTVRNVNAKRASISARSATTIAADM
jgi:hypothetical protein